jgi:hypothetical protein
MILEQRCEPTGPGFVSQRFIRFDEESTVLRVFWDWMSARCVVYWVVKDANVFHFNSCHSLLCLF